MALTLEFVIDLRNTFQLFLCQTCGVLLEKSQTADVCWWLLELKLYREEENFKPADVLLKCFQLPVLHSLTFPYIFISY